MDNSRKDSAEELKEISESGFPFHAKVEAQSSNKIQTQKSNSLTKITYRPMDTAPGTSRYCNCCSSNILKDPGDFGGGETTDNASLQSFESFVCRICHNNENIEKLISPCLCKGSLAYVHSDCLERWISMSRCTTCELCQFQYNTEQTLRYTFYQSLRMWYSRSMSRRALQEDCQMFLLLTLIAFGIVGTLLVAVQYYILKGQISGSGRLWTKGWLIFFLFTTLIVYLMNVYMIIKSQLMPWYRWWQSARDIRLLLVNHKPAYVSLKQLKNDENSNSPTVAIEDSICQSIKMCCRQQNIGRTLSNYEFQQGRENMYQAIDATCHNNTKSMKIFRVRNNNNCNDQMEIGKELQTGMSASSGAAATRLEPSLKKPLEPAFGSLIETV